MLRTMRRLPGEHSFVLSGLKSKGDLRCVRTVPLIIEQLQASQPDGSFKYEVAFEIREGRGCPALDLDNYTKPLLDAITKSQRVWRDDRQIEAQVVRRKRDKSQEFSQVSVTIRRLEGQHGGVPSFFRALCHEARVGHSARGDVSRTYRDVGFQLAMHAGSQSPYDIDDDSWAERINELCKRIEDQDEPGIWQWCCEHFPRWMDLVPKRRLTQFVSGIIQAYDEGRIDA
jgi:hypothetical protein